MNKKQAATIAFLSASAFALAFLASGRLWFRLDLTGGKIHTISEVSRNLYREISDPVRITYFVSDRLERAHPLPGEIADLLKEYAAHSRGKIRFIQKDPARAGLLGKVEDLGIAPRQIQIEEQNEIAVATVYTGILIEYLDREAAIPSVFSLDYLEYDVSSRIRSLIRDTEKELGVIVADAHKQWNSEYGLLDRELALAGFKTRLLRPGEEIPPTLPALFALGGVEDLDEGQLYLIDRYILGGGRVLFAVDGVSVDTRAGFEARAARDGGLLAMLANYGAAVQRALALDRSALNLTYQTQSGDGTVVHSARYPEWIGVQERGGNPNHPLGAGFGGLDLYWASPIELVPPPGVRGEAIFSSSGEAWLQTENFIADPGRLSQFENEAAETRGTKLLGAALSGVFPGAFEGRPKPAGEGSWDEPADPIDPMDPPLQKKPSRIVVVGDSDFAGPLMQASRGERRNLDFLIAAAEWLSSDDDLVAIRGRRSAPGRLDRIADREKRDRAMAFSRALNTAAIPLAVAIAGLFMNRRRKAKTRKRERRGDAV